MNAQSVARGFVPLPGGVKAVYNPSLTTYRVPDWQGSIRIGSNYNRAYIFSVAFAPFGEQYDRGGSWPVEFTFAGNDNETTTNTNPEYDALYRKVHTSQGRWVSPDPAGLAAVDPSNPQTWNRYAYVLNNPLSFIDSLGLETCPSGSYNWCVDVTAPPLGDIGATGGGLRHAPVLDTSGLPAKNTAQRLKCAAQFGSNHSIAAAFGAQNNFLGNLLGGNSVSGLVNLGLFISGDATPTAGQLASVPLKGAAQGIPVPPGDPGLSGAVGQLRGMAVQSAVAGTYNAIAGVGQETIELGITATGTVATPVAQLGTQSLSNVAFGAGIAKFAFDASTVLYGYFVACKVDLNG